MTSEIVIDVQPKEVSIALLEDKSLVELQSEGRNISFSVGNMYLGRIKKLMPGLNACFVDVGYEKDAFLHYLDLGPQFNSHLDQRQHCRAGRIVVVTQRLIDCQLDSGRLRTAAQR